MLIYNDANTNTPFDVGVTTSMYKRVFKRNQSRSKRSKAVKRGGRLQSKVKKARKTRKSRKSGKVAIKILNAKNRKFLRKLGFKVKSR